MAEPLDDIEVERLGHHGLIPPMTGSTDFFIGPGAPRTVLRSTQTYTKIISEGANILVDICPADEQETTYDGDIQDFITAVALTQSGSMTVAGHILYCENPFFGVHSVTPRSIARLRDYARDITIGSGDCVALLATWHSIRTARVRNDTATQRALRRFRYAIERQRSDDRILDFVIALEAILLANLEGAELSYRFALRAAWLLAQDVEQRGATFNAYRAAYNVRSKIAHGAALSAKDLRINGKTVTEEEFANHVESLAREALLKSLELPTDDNGAVGWEKLVLGF